MKYIFDFDDVLFFTTRRRNEYIYPFLEKIGISRDDVDSYYQIVRGTKFSIKKLLSHFFIDEKYGEIMQNSKDYINNELIEIVNNLGKENCIMITYGDEEFQIDKIYRTGVVPLFSEIIIVPVDEKGEIIEKICEKYQDEKIIFIDDKIKHFENLNLSKCPNLTTILYDECGLEKLKAEIQVIISKLLPL